jgi:hypothetical protein
MPKMPALLLIVPLLPGKTEAWRRFYQMLMNSRREDYKASRRRLSITCERIWLVSSSYGGSVIVSIEAQDMKTIITRLAASDNPFDRWFRRKMLELHGIDLAQVFDERNQEMIMVWNQDQPKGGATLF